MKKTVLTLGIALASLLATSAFAQRPGEDQAATSKPATAGEKAAAKSARKAEGKQVAKSAMPGDDKPGTSAKTKIAKSERKAAAAKRKAAGTEATKMEKDKSGPSS